MSAPSTAEEVAWKPGPAFLPGKGLCFVLLRGCHSSGAFTCKKDLCFSGVAVLAHFLAKRRLTRSTRRNKDPASREKP